MPTLAPLAPLTAALSPTIVVGTTVVIEFSIQRQIFYCDAGSKEPLEWRGEDLIDTKSLGPVNGTWIRRSQSLTSYHAAGLSPQ